MNCELCQKNEATVHVKQVADGSLKEMHVCAECATTHGLDAINPTSLTNLILGVGGVIGGAKEEHSCPACHMHDGDFRKTSRLGCPACYEAFSAELAGMLANMQNGARHKGKVPAGERLSAEIAALENALAEAVSAQNFEEAAKLRDGLKELRAARLADRS